MQDFGFSDLRVVNEFAPPFEAAQLDAKSAVGAGQVMASARRYSHLPEAIGDCTLVAGTTAVGGRRTDIPVMPLKDAALAIRSGLAAGVSTVDLAEHSRVALLFGSEKTGLTREHLSFCSHLLTVPMFSPEGRHLSMNLGQAVAVCLYELTREGFEGSRTLPAFAMPGVTVADRERLHELLRETLERSGYAERFPANARTPVVRRLASQLGASRDEAATWMGVFRLVLRAMGSRDSTGST